MAAKLNGSQPSATVHQLKPRKAKGAGGQKRKGPSTTRTKPRPGESKPAAAKKSAHPSDAEVRQNTQNRLVALHQQHRGIEAKMSAAAEVTSELRTKKMEIRAAIQNTCVPLAIYDELHKKVTAKTKRADNELYEKQRAMAFEAFALPVGPTAELDFKDVPEAVRPALHWETLGYQMGVDGQFADHARDGVPPENLQDYMRGFHSATARNSAGIKALKADPAPVKAAAPPLMVGEKPEKAAAKQAARDAAATVTYAEKALAAGENPAWNGFPDDPDLWTDGQKDVFTKWYDAIDPEGPEVDIAHVGAIAMFDRLDEAQAPDPGRVEGDTPPPEPGTPEAQAAGDVFAEATEAELAAQAGRAVNHEPAAEFED